MMLSGWGRSPAIDCRVITPRTPDEVVAAVRATPCLIARGAGRAYGDAALNPDATLSTLRLDRVRSFDAESGLLDAEAGLRLADVIDLVLPHGWFPAVVPGTAEPTIGGMVAADVHGKNHHMDGAFGDHLDEIRLVAADGSVVRCAPGDRPDLFDATLGGMGLTGVVLSARMRLRRVETAFVDVATHRRSDLDGLLSALEGSSPARYSVAWIDTLARGTAFGRGVVFAGDHAPLDALPRSRRSRPLERPWRPRLGVPFDLPAAGLHRRVMAAFNAIYHAVPRPARRIVDVDRFFFPLDAVRGWNRLYGPKGFRQFQCVLPADDGGRGLTRILDLVSTSGTGFFLAVLKSLGAGRRPLSFPIAGHTLALDMPAGAATDTTYRRLCDITVEHGGRIYLAKDALADPVHVGAGYPGAAGFRAARRSDGSAGRFESAQSRRLQL